MKILGPATADRVTVEANLPANAHPRFGAAMLPALWDAATHYGIDPIGIVAQAWKETGGGNYTGRVKPEHYNTCGLKVRHLGYGGPATTGDEQLAHAAFANWTIGAHAHAQHLLAYCGGQVAGLIVDPRYTVVSPPYVTDWEQLGGRWAPSSTYGTEIVTLARRLQGEVVRPAPNGQ
jgi:N-acetylmuramoyl-L-alanine amidase